MSKIFDERPGEAALARRLAKDGLTGATRAVVVTVNSMNSGRDYDVYRTGVFASDPDDGGEPVAIYRQSKSHAIHQQLLGRYVRPRWRLATDGELAGLPEPSSAAPVRRPRTIERLD